MRGPALIILAALALAGCNQQTPQLRMGGESLLTDAEIRSCVDSMGGGGNFDIAVSSRPLQVPTAVVTGKDARSAARVPAVQACVTQAAQS
ncbi:hypothetical protein [Paracoccus pacificus]|uniref:Lipoprotein n=1 Tax=Paracoccus pacificus TaxID=1463598 RepID=A0ABW4R6Z0_9RHOB